MSDIFDERNACNFYRSYWETGQLLPEEERLSYYDAILKAQFTGKIEEPVGNFALLAFKGQVHSIKKQIIGFERGKETYPNGNPTKGKGKGKYKEEQEQEKEQGEVEEKKYNTDIWGNEIDEQGKPVTTKTRSFK